MSKPLRIAGFLFVFVFFSICCFCFAQEKEYVAPLQEKPRPQEQAGKLSLNSYYEHSFVQSGSRRGRWHLSAQNISYSLSDTVIPYYEIDLWQRFDERDEVHKIGAYFSAKDKSSFGRLEVGFGRDIDYIYKSQVQAEYGRKINRNLFWQSRARYLNYPQNDVYILSPGIINYFGENFIESFYNVSFTESRDAAHFLTFLANFKLTKKLEFRQLLAVGERLFDAREISADKQWGYIILPSLRYRIFDDVGFNLGFSYSKERPDFYKRSIEASFNIRF